MTVTLPRPVSSPAFVRPVPSASRRQFSSSRPGSTADRAPGSTASRAPGSTRLRRESASLGPKPDAKILFQKFFKSVGPRTYAAQLKEAGNGNHFLVLTEGKRDDKTGEVRKTRLFVFSEDFGEFFGLIDELGKFARENPVSPEVAAKQQKFWKKKGTS